MRWLARTFGGAFVRKLGYIAAVLAVAIIGGLLRDLR